VTAVRPTARRRFALVAPLLAALLLTPAAGIAARATPPDDGEAPLADRREVRAALREADQAMAAGSFDRAAELYEQVVASTGEGDGQRATALYGLALAQALRPPESRDTARAAAALRELTAAFPRHERSREAAAGLACFDRLEAAGAETERLGSRVAELEAAAASQAATIEQQAARLAELDAAAEGRAGTLETESTALRKEVGRLRARLAEVEAELEKKQEALEKVKQTLVGSR
jgi:predicted RNase H-like nuclease (RuvC/YqgF family)